MKIIIAAMTPINTPMQPTITLIRCCPMLLVECVVKVRVVGFAGMTVKKIICEILIERPNKIIKLTIITV